VPLSVMMGSLVFSQAVGPLLAAGLLALDGVGKMQGWQYLFLIEGLMAVVLAFGWCAAGAPGGGPLGAGHAARRGGREHLAPQAAHDASRAGAAAPTLAPAPTPPPTHPTPPHPTPPHPTPPHPTPPHPTPPHQDCHAAGH
jgi:MFS family permease